MRLSAKHFSLALAAVFLFARSAGAQTGDASHSDKFINSFPVPVGENAIDIRLPYWDGQLKTMDFKVGVMEHKDPEHLQLTNAKITTFDENEKVDLILLLPVSVFDLRTRLLTTDKPFILMKTDMELMGDALQLDTVTRQATITGKVKMIIYNFQEHATKDPAHE